MKKIPIGISDFEKIIDGNYYYIDKTLLIKELLDNGAEAVLVPRPRRFGKTLNLSTLRYFFEKNAQSKRHLFKDLNIADYPDCMQHQGIYPVIFISLKEAKVTTWSSCYKIMMHLIQSEFARHSYLLESATLSPLQKKAFTTILEGTADQEMYQLSLKNLTELLVLFHGKKPIILIDEYDSPIHAGFTNDYYDEVINFMRSFLSAGLKDNPNLSFAVITGILRVAKESIFSGLNNLDVCSILSSNYADKFGLLEQEVHAFLNNFNLSAEVDNVKHWYNGYSMGENVTVYNPWSIINFVAKGGKLQPYWVNTSDNALIKELLIKSAVPIKKDIERLLAGENIEKKLNENIVFSTLFSDEDTVWSFLLLSGYLSFDKTYINNGLLFASLRLPNIEVSSFYTTTILNWLKSSLDINNYYSMLQSLVAGDIEEFKDIFYEIVFQSLSSFDTSGDEPEKFYHALVLGMLVSLNQNYEINSNRESGYGRYDLMIIPKNVTPVSYGVIIEFKRVNKRTKETLEQAATNALKQIEDKKYEAHLKERNVTNIIKLAIVFEGKQVLVTEG